ncbi:hypothetical protein [Thiosulfativibrio zosterae]|uniref:Lipoprotein n=1 Tax=Thiosulfativibrio zosterae TaxID=2675053 RepID=A0A6F8PRB4_9GAMM|nr:hypothetical protein [Thiosulfativibrio zosterae]BBP44568.1 hypothetical protein THMIRHAT_23140 [Thiosulfativibrio zosterae]
MVKKIIFLIGVLSIAFLSGCATHANIEMKALTKVSNKGFENKSFSYEIFYSQPRPGVFSDGEQLALKPLKDQELSVAAANTLSKIGVYMEEQLPVSSKVVPANGDYNLKISIIAHDKHGPSYADYDALASFGKGLITFGLGSSEYTIKADFDITYALINTRNNELVFEKSFNVKDSVDHERSKLESISSTQDYAGKLFEKHITSTMNEFMTDSAKKI